MSYTFDERVDIGIVNCLNTQSPFNCLDDISQTRVPFYIHSFFTSVFDHRNINHLVSYFFSIILLLITWNFTRKTFNPAIANIAILFLASSIPVLTASRMVLTHSNIIFTTFNLLAVFQFYQYVKNRKFSSLIISAVFYGLAIGSSVLAVSTIFYFAAFYILMKVKFEWKQLLFPPICIFSFFFSTLIYFDPGNLISLRDGLFHGYDFPYWNYLSKGVSVAPYYYSFLLFYIKTGIIPSILILLTSFLLIGVISKKIKEDQLTHNIQVKFMISVLIWVILYLLLKSAWFGYDAPHHQVHLYPLVYIIASWGVYKLLKFSFFWRKVFSLVLLAGIVIQFNEIRKFFPNLLFYGAQYGENFIGEFYGPAVVHGQDQDTFNLELKKIIEKKPDSRILFLLNNAFELSGPNFIAFTGYDEVGEFDYAVTDRCFTHHFDFPETKAYVELLENNCTEIFIYNFPEQIWMYKIYKCGN